MKRIIGLLFILILNIAAKAQSTIDGNWDFHRDGQSSGTLRLKDSSYEANYILMVYEETPVRIIVKGDLPECFYDLLNIRLDDENERIVDVGWKAKTINEIGRIFETPELKAGRYFLNINGYELDNIHSVTPEMPDYFDLEYTIDCRGLQQDLGSLHTGTYTKRTSKNMDILTFGKMEGQELTVSVTTQPNTRMNTELKKFEQGKGMLPVDIYKELEYTDDTHQVIRIAPELSGDLSLTIMADDRDSTTVCCPFSYTAECLTHSSFNKNFSVSDNVSYIRKRTFQRSDGSQYLDEIQYFNGLGFPIQKVQKGITPLRKNLIALQEYDGLGRATKKWLPVSANSSYLYQENEETIRWNACQQYKDIAPFTLSCYETSSREEMTKLYNPGYRWHTHIHDRFTAHNKSENATSIQRFRLNSISGKLERDGYYAKGVLLMETTTDEDLKKNYLFKNTQGETLLIRQTNEKDNLDTYYIYDSFGNLRYVLPPVLSNGANLNDESTDMKRYAYLYRYDYRNRCIAKRLPGCGWIYYAYDMTDQLVYSQDSLQRQGRKCTFRLTDALQREVVTGICIVENSVSGFLPDVSQEEVKAVYRGGSENGELQTGYAFQNMHGVKDLEILTVNYYDSYKFPACHTRFGELSFDVNGYGKRYGDNSDSLRHCHKGLLTGHLNAILGTNNYLYNTMYYDKHHHCIQTQSINHLGSRESNMFDYNYTGQVLTRKHAFSSPGPSPTEELYEYSYDHAGRLTDVYYQPFQTINGALISMENAHLADIRYNEQGKLETIIHHDGWGNTLSYEYNIRGWMTRLQGENFEQRLQYESPSYDVKPCFNGNISCMIWKADTLTRGYTFLYDGLDRLRKASYAEGDSLKQNSGRFNEEVTGYDKLGNVLGLKRYGQTSKTGYGVIDNLNMTYNGSQLSSVTDSAISSAYAGNTEFKDGTNLPIEYFYDGNGNLTKDLNKKIVDIQYNCLNLPCQIEFEDGNSISYLYAADGKKLRTMHCIDGETLTTDYCDNAIYENGVLTRLLNEYGYLSLSPDTTYHYFTRDHQGNVRVVVSPERKVKEVNHYYPFGGMFASQASAQPYKYNGKELDRKGGLDWYDYGVRYYDAALGKWHVMDELNEHYYSLSPYNYCTGNPVNLIDSDGMEPEITADLPEVTIIGKKITNSISGFWNTMGYYLLGRTATLPVYGITDDNTQTSQPIGYITYNVNKEGVAISIAPKGGIGPMPARTGLSIKEITELLKAGKTIYKAGLTVVGRGLKKHGDRAGSAFPKAIGNQAAINQQGENVLKSILEHPNVERIVNDATQTFKANRFGANSIDYKIPGGIGARFSADGKFITFLEP